MHQLEFLVVRFRIRLEDARAQAGARAMTWDDLPVQAKFEVVKDVAEMLRKHLERVHLSRRVVGEASDE